MVRSFLPLMLLPALATAEIKTERFAYREGGQELEGYVTYDTAQTGSRPTVLVIHDWNGLDAYEEGRARQLAELGYVGIALDVYGKGVRPKNAEESAAEAGRYRADRDLFRRRLQAGYDAAKRLPNVDSGRIAVMGYCFGGGAALEMARMGLDLKGAVSFHGSFRTDRPAKEGQVRAKVLVLHASGDPSTPREDQIGLIDELRGAKVDYQIVFYNLDTHAFTVPGPSYDVLADRRSWRTARDFFAEVLGTR